MIQRCENPKTFCYHLYGGAGIKVCPEWRRSFLAFFAHIGPRPSAKHSIDRIDSSKNYEPGNVRWATVQEQNRNPRQGLITVNGETKHMWEWAEISGLSSDLISQRINIAGWAPERAVTRPVTHKWLPGDPIRTRKK